MRKNPWMICGAKYGLSGFFCRSRYTPFTSEVARSLHCIIGLILGSLGMAVVDAPLHRDDGILMVRRNVGGQYCNGLNSHLNSGSGSGMREKVRLMLSLSGE
ncbi:hypothetical protein XPA_009174 [Xanthoria parietina]